MPALWDEKFYEDAKAIIGKTKTEPPEYEPSQGDAPTLRMPSRLEVKFYEDAKGIIPETNTKSPESKPSQASQGDTATIKAENLEKYTIERSESSGANQVIFSSSGDVFSSSRDLKWNTNPSVTSPAGGFNVTIKATKPSLQQKLVDTSHARSATVQNVEAPTLVSAIDPLDSANVKKDKSSLAFEGAAENERTSTSSQVKNYMVSPVSVTNKDAFQKKSLDDFSLVPDEIKASGIPESHVRNGNLPIHTKVTNKEKDLRNLRNIRFSLVLACVIGSIIILASCGLLWRWAQTELTVREFYRADAYDFWPDILSAVGTLGWFYVIWHSRIRPFDSSRCGMCCKSPITSN